jgi:putative hemolysin
MPSCFGHCGLGPSECQACSEAAQRGEKQQSKKKQTPPSDPRRRFAASFTIAPPREGTNERRGLNFWLNLQHCGQELPPEDITREHEDAAYAMCRHQGGELVLELQRDGSYRATSLKFGGETFDLEKGKGR